MENLIKGVGPGLRLGSTAGSPALHARPAQHLTVLLQNYRGALDGEDPSASCSLPDSSDVTVIETGQHPGGPPRSLACSDSQTLELDPPVFLRPQKH